MTNSKAFRAVWMASIGVGSMVVVAMAFGRWITYPGGDLSRLYGSLEAYMLKKLVVEKPLPSTPADETAKSNTVIYVLGGNQVNLALRFRKAAELYHQGFSRKILILSRPGTTEFSPDVGRNLTNDEWCIRELEILKVGRTDIEPVQVRSGLFGTLSEAKAVSEIVRSEGCRRLVLVTSNYHTRRTWMSFSKYLSTASPDLYVYGVGNAVEGQELLAEYLRLLAYKYVILPLDH